MPKAGDQQTFSHWHEHHGLMTIVYQCSYVLPKNARIPYYRREGEPAYKIEVLADHIQMSRTLTVKGNTTIIPKLYLARSDWATLGQERCPLCGQTLQHKGI
jgi:hypothetical protein